MKTNVLKFSSRLTITFQAASHECALAERYSLLNSLHRKQSLLVLGHPKKNSFRKGTIIDFDFTPGFLIRFRDFNAAMTPEEEFFEERYNSSIYYL